MKAVAYARYSSHGQKETSIEGQLKAIYDYAARNNIMIIRDYVDRAQTGTTDKREQFQKMIADSVRQQFDAVIVYTFDRFARNRYDSATYKARLMKNGIRVISAKENISDDPSGILMESVLEGMAEYYSAELSQKVKRGISLSVEKCKYIGGHVPLGYRVTETKNYEIDPLTAPIVKKCFELYASGFNLKHINETIVEDYGKPLFGNACNSINRILANRNYKGVYTRCGADVENGMPRIVSDELFDKVKTILSKNKKAPAGARARAHEEYLLTTKLFCGYDREMMVGVSGTSKTGAIHHYYTCKNVWGKKGCKKKNVKKQYIEDFIFAKAREQLTDENIDIIAQAVSELSNKANNTPYIMGLKKKIKDNETAIENLLTAIETGEHIELLSERITKKKAEKAELEKALATERLKSEPIEESEIRFFLTQLKNGDINDEKYRRAIITIFVNAVYLYDDRATIIFNASGRPAEVDYSLLEDMIDSTESEGAQSSYTPTYAPPFEPVCKDFCKQALSFSTASTPCFCTFGRTVISCSPLL